MSKKADGLIADYLNSRWSATYSTTGATVNAVISAPQSATSRHHVETVTYAIANMNAAAHTVAVELRDTSVAGTILASWRHFVPGSTTATVQMTKLGIMAAKGVSVHLTTDTFLGSVSPSVNMAGWTDKSSDY